MLRKHLIALLFVFLSACSVVAQPAPRVPEKVVLESIPSPSAVPLPTPTEISPTASPVPTLDPAFFRDDFTGQLDAAWSWVREDPRYWSLNMIPGSLQVSVGSGYVVAASNSNLLLRPAPAGDFQIETQITFRPTRNFQFAGLIIYESDWHFIQAGRAFCQGSDCDGEGLYMNYYEAGVLVEPSYGQVYNGIDPVLLRLSREGEAYTFEGSTNGKVWFAIGRRTSQMNPLQIGLVAGQKITGNSRPALFDYFEVRSLP